jgi:hypothetical protein
MGMLADRTSNFLPFGPTQVNLGGPAPSLTSHTAATIIDNAMAARLQARLMGLLPSLNWQQAFLDRAHFKAVALIFCYSRQVRALVCRRQLTIG